MSLQGKLLRGLKWYNFRNVEGEYLKDVKEHPHKMEEVKFYLDFLKGKDDTKVHKLLEKLHLLDLSNKPRKMALLAKKLLDEEFLKEEPKKEAPKKLEKK